jgi:mannose-6-phosphate isomerase-like protein (cupin superfamily)
VVSGVDEPDGKGWLLLPWQRPWLGGNMQKPYRRIVTTNDASGKSEVLIDGPATNESAIFTEMWVTEGMPHNHTDHIDHAINWKSLEPPLGGSVFRFFRLAPMSAFEGLSDEQREQLIAQAFAGWNASHTRRDISKNPLMHQTRTTDYIIVLSGEVTLVLDKEERDLKPFDVVIQRGTNHAWINKGSGEAVLMAVLVDDGLAKEEQPGGASA